MTRAKSLLKCKVCGAEMRVCTFCLGRGKVWLQGEKAERNCPDCEGDGFVCPNKEEHKMKPLFPELDPTA